jgi:thioredoxin-dependent peroxiredoxin
MSMRVRALIRAAAAAIVLTLGVVTAVPALEVGQKAPDFTLPAAGGKTVKLSELLGKGPIVLYTFIQAFTKT